MDARVFENTEARCGGLHRECVFHSKAPSDIGRAQVLYGTVFAHVSIDNIRVEHATLKKGKREVIAASEVCEVHDGDDRFVLCI